MLIDLVYCESILYRNTCINIYVYQLASRKKKQKKDRKKQTNEQKSELHAITKTNEPAAARNRLNATGYRNK